MSWRSAAIDLGPARREHARATDAFRARRYRAAIERARHAESWATRLARDHAAAKQAIAKLRADRTRITPTGVSLAEVDALLDRATAAMTAVVEMEDDGRLTAYEEAERLAEEGVELLRDRVSRSVEMLRAVSEAEARLGALRAGIRSVRAEVLDESLVGPAEAALAAARAGLATGGDEDAAGRAWEAIARAETVDQEVRRAVTAYEITDGALRSLREEGAPVASIEVRFARARTSLEMGDLRTALEIIQDSAGEITRLRNAHRSIVLHAREARDAVAQVEEWGFNVHEALDQLREADRCIGAGRYDEATIAVARAREIASGIRETHRTLASRIADLRRPVTGLRVRDPARAVEADGLLARAESLLDEGLYGECEETLESLRPLLPNPAEGASIHADPSVNGNRTTNR